MPTVTSRLLSGNAVPVASAQFHVFVELASAPNIVRQLLSGVTDGSGNLSITLEEGTYQLRIPSTRDQLRFKVPPGSATLSLSNLLLF